MFSGAFGLTLPDTDGLECWTKFLLGQPIGLISFVPIESKVLRRPQRYHTFSFRSAYNTVVAAVENDWIPLIAYAVNDWIPLIAYPVNDWTPSVSYPVNDWIPLVAYPVIDWIPLVAYPMNDWIPVVSYPVNDWIPLVAYPINDRNSVSCQPSAQC